MGCDIHMCIEYRVKPTAAWKALGRWRDLGSELSAEALNANFNNLKKYYTGDNWRGRLDEILAAHSPEAPRLDYMPFNYTCRNYELFAALANVRNYNAVTPIDMPRGMVVDATNEVRCEWLSWFGAAHSTSHFSLFELTTWGGWEQTFQFDTRVARGRDPVRRLSDETFEKLQRIANENGKIPWDAPDGWNLTYWTQIGEDRSLWRSFSYEARLEWAVGVDWWVFIAKVHRLGVKYGPDNVRLVFWFDN